MQRKNRLSRSRDFDAVYRHGRSASTRFLTLHWFERSADDEGGEPRLGLAVPRAAGNAVVRNRMKRRFRALSREILPELGIAGADHVLIGRTGGIERDYASLASELKRALKKVAAT